MNRHAALMDASNFWRQFVTAFYFETKGDEVAGAVVWYGPAAPKPDDPPQLRIQTREGRLYEVTATQERLRAKLCQLEPAVGDRIRIVYDGEADKAAPGFNKAKLFTVEVRRQGSRSEQAQPAPSGEVPRDPVPAGDTP